MIKSHLTLAIRNFQKGRLVSVVNLAGLAVGLASVMLIIAFISYELSFDKHYENSDRIYQLVMESGETLPAVRTNVVPIPLGNTLMQEFAEIEATTLFSPNEIAFLVNEHPELLKTLVVSSNFFDIFRFTFVRGNPKTALLSKSGIVITERTASCLFPGKEPLGQTMTRKTIDGTAQSFTITGVIKNIPGNTHFSTDVIETFPDNRPQEALNFAGFSALPQYVLIRKNSDVARLQAKLHDTLKKYGLRTKNNITMLKVTDIHLRSGDINSIGLNTGDIRYIYILGSVAILILVIGCINYINLTTAQSLQRIKEVSIRKTLGSMRMQLALQFIGESFLFFIAALLLAFLLAALLWPAFNSAMHVQLPMGELFGFKNILTFGSLALLAGIISGVYPAIFLSNMQPANILKTSQNKLSINFSLRKTLIVLQFSISVVLVICTIVVWQQLELFKNRPLGFNKEHLLVVSPILVPGSPSAFKNTILSNPNILAASFVNMKLGTDFGNKSSNTNPFDSTQRLDFAYVHADFDFVKTMGIRLREGRSYSPAFGTDGLNIDSANTRIRELALKEKKDPAKMEYLQESIIITESVVKKLRLKKPLNSVLFEGSAHGKVVGVLEDFQLTTLKKESPLLIYSLGEENRYANIYIRLNSSNIPKSIRFIEKTWKQFFPDQLFQYAFADDSLQKLYESENRLASIFTLFAILAIAISSLGLFSLVALIVKQRFKEIGVRKVMGASVPGIVMLLSKDFLKLIILGVVIASPFGWYGANKWLENFANRIEVEWWFFALAGTMAVLTGAFTVIYQTIHAARMNPVHVLKSE